MSLKKFVLPGLLLASFFLIGSVAHASTVCSGGVGSPLVLDVTQNISNDPDSGVDGTYWALDNYARHIQVWLDTDGTTYCAQVDYNGTFAAPSGVSSPQKSERLSNAVSGTFVGGYTASIVGTITSTSSIPTTVDYQGVLPTGAAPGYVSWLGVTFSPGYVFNYLNNGNDWKWTYTTPINAIWVNAGTGNSGDIGPVVDTNTNTGYGSIQTAISAASASDTISLGSDVTTSSQLEIAKSITIDGNNHTLTTTAIGGSVIDITSSNVTLKNLTVDGGGATANNRGINVYRVTGVTMDNVTSQNNKKNGIVVNGSTVTVNDISTKNNGWEGIDVDKGTVSSPATLTVTGTSSHSGDRGDIFVDDTTIGVVSDTEHQYSYKDTGTSRLYTLLKANQITPDSNGSVTVTKTGSTIVVSNPVQTITVDAGGHTGATLDFSSLTGSGSKTIPAVTIKSGNSNVTIPDQTNITGSGWNGVLNLPTVVTTTVQPTVNAGQVANVVSSIEVGANDTPLTLSKAARLVFPGQAGKLIGWSRNGVFTQITNTCHSDDQASGDTLGAGGDCTVNVGNDLVVWTRHFTTFTTYTESASGGNGGGGSIGGSRASVTAQAHAAPQGKVLGAFTTSDTQAQIVLIKSQLVTLIQQLIQMLQAQLAVIQEPSSIN